MLLELRLSIGNHQAEQSCLSANLRFELRGRRSAPALLQGSENVAGPCHLGLRLSPVREAVVVQVVVGPSSLQAKNLELLPCVTGIRFAAVLQAESQLHMDLLGLRQSHAAVLQQRPRRMERAEIGTADGACELGLRGTSSKPLGAQNETWLSP